MIKIAIQDKKLRAALTGAARQYPAVAVDAMSRAMLGLRKDFLADLRPRMPRMAAGRAQYQFWRVTAWRSQRDNVVGKFQPANKTLQRNLAVLEFGGTLRPRDQEAMAIPARGAKASSGLTRKEYRKGPTAWLIAKAGRRLAQIREGDKIILFRRGKDGRPTGPPLWVLARTVTIRPILGLRAFWARPASRAAFVARIEKVLLRDLFPKRRAA